MQLELTTISFQAKRFLSRNIIAKLSRGKAA